MAMQSILSIIYPAQCIGCGGLVAEQAALCPDCWRDTPFILGSVCISCGAPLMGEAPGDDVAKCDECMITDRAWTTGTSVLVYKGIARRLVMALKHGDRHDLVAPFSNWMVSRLRKRPGPGDFIVPVPIHWRRMISRKFNQSALLAKAIADQTGATYLPDAFIRLRYTALQDGLNFDERFALQKGSIAPHQLRSSVVAKKNVLLVDDVMTSGATLTSASGAILAAGAERVDTVTLARVVKDF